MNTKTSPRHYDYATSLGSIRLSLPSFSSSPSAASANAPSLKEESPGESLPGESFSDEGLGTQMTSAVKRSLERQIAGDFLQAKSKGVGLLTGLELRGIIDFLAISERSFASLLGVSQRALSAMLSEELLSPYLSRRTLVVLDAEIWNAGFAKKFASGDDSEEAHRSRQTSEGQASEALVELPLGRVVAA